MSEILNNIWNTLSKDNQTNSGFDAWKSNFYESPEVQTNVYKYLKENNYTQSDANTWVSNINKSVKESGGKTKFVGEVDYDYDRSIDGVRMKETSYGKILDETAYFVKDVIGALGSLGSKDERSKALELISNRASNIDENLMGQLVSTKAALADIFTTDIDYDPKELEYLKTLDPNAPYTDPMGDPTGFKNNAAKIDYLENYADTDISKRREKGEDYIIEKFQELKTLDLLKKDTGRGIVGGARAGSGAEVLAGAFGAVMGMVETAVPAMATKGLSLPMQIAAPMYSDYNKAKAKAIYGDDPESVNKLIESGQTELAIPLALGTLATALEYVGLKGITKYISSQPGKGTAIAKLVWTGNGEGLTEVGQLGTETINTSLASGDDIETASMKAWDVMTSDEGLEMWLNGFIGSTTVSSASRAVNRALRSDNASVKELNNKINNLADLNNKKYNTKKESVKEGIELEIKKAEEDIRSYIKDKRKINEILNEEQKTSLVNILNSKDNIKSKIDSLVKDLKDNKISKKEFGYALRGFTNQDKKLSEDIELVNETAKEQLLQTSLETTKKQSEKLGLEQVELSKEEFAQQFPDDANSDGAIVDGKIFINRDVAREQGAIGVGSHELLHGIIGNSYKKLGKEEKIKLNTEFLNLLGKKEKETIINRLADSYGIKGDGVFETEELFTVFSDAIVDGGLPFNEGVFGKIRNTIHKVLNKFGYQKEFENARQTYNFLKDYSKNIKEGKLTERAGEFAKQDPGVKDIRTSKTTSEAASLKVQSIYEDQGATGAFDIINEFKPIVGKIVEKRRDAPNFDRELLTSEIEIGKRGILDLIAEYKPESGVPLAAFINKYLPSRAIEASRRVLGEEFTEDVSERVDIAAEEVAEVDVQAKPKKKKIVLSQRLRIENKIDEAVASVFSKLDLNNLNFKTLKDLTPKITGEMFGISPGKLTTLANITKKELQSAQMFISKNADLLIAMMPEGTTASGTATGIPNSLLKEFYTKTDRAKAAKTGNTSGLAVQVKNDINKKQFLEVFGIIDGKPIRTDRNTSARVLSLASLTGKMMTNQAVRKILVADQSSPAHVLGVLEDGKSEVMFSKSIKQDIGALQRKANKKTVKPGRSVNVILEDLWGFVPINMNTDKGRKEYVAKVYPILGKHLPKSFFLWAGNFTGTTKKVIDISEGIAQEKRAPSKNLPYVNTEETKNAVKSAEQVYGKNVFAKPDIDIENALKRLSYKDIGKKLLDGAYLEFNISKAKGMKKIWLAFATAVKEDPANARIIAALLSSTSSQQRHFMRTMAPIKFFNSLNLPNVEEHTDPATFFGNYLFTRLLEGTLFDAKTSHYDNALKSYFQGSLPDVYDKLLKGNRLDGTKYDYTSQLPVKHAIDVLLGKTPVWIRYINEDVNNNNGGIDPNVIQLDNGNTLAQEYSVDVSVENTTPLVIKQQQRLLFEIFTEQTTKAKAKKFINNFAKVKIQKNTDQIESFSKSVSNARKVQDPKGITVLDFDDTLATSKSLIRYTTTDGTKGTLTPEQYASTYQDLQDLGYEFDFSEFNKVVDGKIAPLFQKALKLQSKFGNNDMFVLTARPSEAAPAIFAFLKANGLNIPLENITGLANSTAEAKALWMADKVGEGYNDFYFADDALQNVQAVDNMLNQFDVKRKVQQAKIKFSKSMNKDFNNMLENITGIESKKTFDFIKARKRGASKGKFRLFIPPSHEDFVGLLYNFMGKGKEGDAHRDFLEQALVRPLNRANKEYDTARQSIATDYKNLNKEFSDVRKMLTKKTPDGDFTYQDAIRIYLWDKHGHKIPGLSPVDQKNLVELVEADGMMQSYADAINTISKQETYVTPTEGWNSGDIRMDLDDATGRVGRAQFFEEFNENADIIFSKENLNKIEAGYGKGVREALEDILYRIKTGRNRPSGQNQMVNKLMNWVNGSVGSVMFFNMRSALLQQMSIVNYINFADNNIFAAAKAFANQKQYWADWAFIFNSDMLKQRRGGIMTDVNGAELAADMRKSKSPHRFLISKLLELGFLPTQIGDNIAIATGGASYYRNRINSYLKQGLSLKEAETKAFTDFQDITQSTQQSARPDMVSQQQASVIGKVILNFQNVTSQFNRLGKKAFQDIYNRRITKPNSNQLQSDISNASRITYYFAVQNLIFYTLQTALFAMMFGDEEEDDNKLFLKKKERLINGTIDSVLRGTGLLGGVVATLKNVGIAFARQRDVKYNPDESAVIMEALNLSPVLGIKARKISNAEKTLNYNKKVIKKMETFDIDNPQWSAYTNYVEAGTNLPLNRLYNKTQNVRQALNNDHAAWERTLLFLGWSQYNLNLTNEKMDAIKKSTKKKKKSKTKGRKTR